MNLEVDRSETCDKVMEVRSDGKRVTGQDPIIEEEGGEVNRVRESGGGHTAGLEDDGVDGKCEECGPQWIALLDAGSAVDGGVADDERGGRPVTEVSPRSDLGEGLSDSLQDGRTIDGVEGILDVNENQPGWARAHSGSCSP